MWGIETETLFEFEATEIVKGAEGGVRYFSVPTRCWWLENTGRRGPLLEGLSVCLIKMQDYAGADSYVT
jgi:hypothetical protein